MFDDVNHPALIQECKFNIDAASYENKVDDNWYKPSTKKENDRHDSNLYWTTSIKDIIQWIFFSIQYIEHTSNILNSDKGLIPSLFKVFPCFSCVYFILNIMKKVELYILYL